MFKKKILDVIVSATNFDTFDSSWQIEIRFQLFQLQIPTVKKTS